MPVLKGCILLGYPMTVLGYLMRLLTGVPDGMMKVWPSLVRSSGSRSPGPAGRCRPAWRTAPRSRTAPRWSPWAGSARRSSRRAGCGTTPTSRQSRCGSLCNTRPRSSDSTWWTYRQTMQTVRTLLPDGQTSIYRQTDRILASESSWSLFRSNVSPICDNKDS